MPSLIVRKKKNKQDKDHKPNVIINWISNFRTTYMHDIWILNFENNQINAFKIVN